MKKLLVFLLVVGVVLLVLWRTAGPSPSDATLRELSTGTVLGYEDESNTYAWKGIPFAQPPVGELRWRAPRPPRPWEGVREALEYGPSCPQMIAFDWLPFKPVLGSEDCLYLDIWTPRLSPSELETANLPVMVYIHGGGNTVGMSAAIRHYRLAGNENVIVVALQYRLGLFGWFSHPALRDTALDNPVGQPMDASSNFALLDMIAALEWVQQNIRAFGGNPDNVTVFGQSAGGFNVYALLASPAAKGLFHKAISQSGNIQTMPRALVENFQDDTEPGFPYSSREFINRLLVGDERAANREEAKALQQEMSAADLSSYLRGKSISEIFDAVEPRGMLGYYTYANVRDGVVLPDRPMLELFSNPQDYNVVPVILGNNRDEFKLFMWGMERFSEEYSGLLTRLFSSFYPALKDSEDYNRMTAYFSNMWEAGGVNEPAIALSRSQPGEVYAYRLDWARQQSKNGVDLSELFGAAHGIDTVFLMGPDAVSGMPAFAQAENENDYDVMGDMMRGYWAEFARTGRPGRGGDPRLPEWTAWGEEGGNKLLFDLPGQGLRMTDQVIVVGDLKKRLRDDAAINSDRERCELYVQMFWYGLTMDFYDDAEYRALGCSVFPRENFKGML